MKKVEMPVAVSLLPKDERGYPIAFFAASVKGKPNLGLADPRKKLICWQKRLCWICGMPIFGNLAFVGGPNSVAQQCFGDAPMHEECATYSVQSCPFMADPNYKRRVITEGETEPGHLPAKPDRNAVYVTDSCQAMSTPTMGGSLIFKADKAISITWWRHGQRIEA